MDTKKMRACAPLLPAPGDEVVCECLDEIERLQSRLADRERLLDFAEAKLAEHGVAGWFDEARRVTPNAELNGARRASDLSAELGAGG